MRRSAGAAVLVAWLWQSASPARAQSISTIIVTAPGGAFDEDDADRLDARQLRRGGRADLLGGLAASIAGISLSDAQNNPYQPNLVYRGYVASPLQGGAQGLAVYVDGIRFNQPFGDTVAFDLLPETAIRRVSVKDASPVYGLNALGGALVVETATGRSAPGFSLAASGGDHGRADVSVEAGVAGERWSGYLALEEAHDAGWRRHSPSTLYRGLADIGYDGEKGGLHLKLLGADTDLTGNGAAPVELLAADRRAVFTWPDNTRNRFARISLHPWLALSDTTRLEASLYWQTLRQRTLNGDAADIEECEEEEGFLCLESASGEEDEATPLRDRNGDPVADIADGDPYGVLNRSRTRSRAGGMLVQLVDRRPLGKGENVLALGFSHDRSLTRFGASTELGHLTDVRNVAGLGPVIDQPDGAIAPVLLAARTRYTGLFLADSLPLLPGLTAEIGLRYNIARLELEDRLGTALNGRHRFRRFNPGLELDYRPSASLKLSLGYAETNRAPTPAELACASPDAPCSLTNFFVGDPPLRQVVARTWQAGVSGQTAAGGWPIDWKLNVWRAGNRDDIQFVASDIRGRAYFRNIGTTRRQGMELALHGAQGPWDVRLGYAFTDATFRTPLTLNSPDNPSAAGDGSIQVRRGARLPGIPRHRAILSVEYRGPAFSIGGDVQAQSGQYLFGDESNREKRTAAFAIVDLHGSIALAEHLSFFAEVSNVLDKRYATFGTFSDTSEVALREAPDASDPRSLGPGAPRRWRAGLRAGF